MNFYESVVAALAILMPVFLVMAFRGGRRGGGAGAADQQQMTALAEAAQRMERRIESLELLLDSEVPGWRSRSTMR